MAQRIAGFYDPADVIVNIGLPKGPGGIPIVIPNLPNGISLPWAVSGFAPDSFVQAMRDADTAGLVVGADGESVTNISQNKSGTVTIDVLASSLTNIILSLMHEALENKVAGLRFMFPIQITDLNSLGTVASAQGCTIRKVADLGRGASLGTNQWTFNAPGLRIFHGGQII